MCRGGDRHTRHVRKNNVRCADTQYICKSYKIEIHHNIRDIYIYLSIDRSIYLYIYSSICLFIYLSTNTNIHRSIEYRAHSHFDARNVSKMHVRTRLRMCVCLCVCTIHHLPPTLSPSLTLSPPSAPTPPPPLPRTLKHRYRFRNPSHFLSRHIILKHPPPRPRPQVL